MGRGRVIILFLFWSMLGMAQDGDFVVRYNASNTDELPDGDTLTCRWNGSTASSGSTISYSGTGNFDLSEAGHYMVMYSDQWGTTSTNNNRRNNVMSHLYLGGSETNVGRSCGYIRKSNGSQEYINSGGGIVNAAAGQDLRVVHERVDITPNIISTNRIADRSGISIIKIPDDWSYFRAERTTNLTLTSTSTAIDWITTIEEDSPFSLQVNDEWVDTTTDSLVVLFASIPIENDATTSDREEYQMHVEYDDGTTTTTYIIDQTYPRSFSNAVPPEDSDFGCLSGRIVLECETGSSVRVVAYRTGDQGGTGNTAFVYDASIQLVELPGSAKSIILTDSGGEDMNAAGDDFNWTTQEQIDTDIFTHSSNDANIEVDEADDYLVFAYMTHDSDNTGARAVPATGLKVNSTELETCGASSYSRQADFCENPATNISALVTGLSATDDIYVRNDRIGTEATSIGVDEARFTAIQLSSLFPATGGGGYGGKVKGVTPAKVDGVAPLKIMGI